MPRRAAKLLAFLGHAPAGYRTARIALRPPDREACGTLLDEVGQLGWADVLAEQYGSAIRHMARGVGIAQRTRQSRLNEARYIPARSRPDANITETGQPPVVVAKSKRYLDLIFASGCLLVRVVVHLVPGRGGDSSSH